MKLQTYVVTLPGHPPVPVLATSKKAAYNAACGRLSLPSNRRPLAESIVVGHTPVGTTIR